MLGVEWEMAFKLEMGLPSGKSNQGPLRVRAGTHFLLHVVTVPG